MMDRQELHDEITESIRELSKLELRTLVEDLEDYLTAARRELTKRESY